MCAINPVHKKRIIFDFYTADKSFDKEAFDKDIIEWCLRMESAMNSFGKIRCHVKETEQPAE